MAENHGLPDKLQSVPPDDRYFFNIHFSGVAAFPQPEEKIIPLLCLAVEGVNVEGEPNGLERLLFFDFRRHGPTLCRTLERGMRAMGIEKLPLPDDDENLKWKEIDNNT